MGKRLVALVTAVSFGSLFVIGCENAPQQELSTAKAALDSAKMAEADKYMASEFNAAQDSLNAAVAEIEKQKAGSILTSKYDRAKVLLASATTAAQHARTQAQSEKQKIASDVDSSLVKATTSLTEIKDLLAKAPKNAVDTIGKEVLAVEASLGETQKLKTDGNLIDARDKAIAEISMIDSLKVKIVKASEKPLKTVKGKK